MVNKNEIEFCKTAAFPSFWSKGKKLFQATSIACCMASFLTACGGGGDAQSSSSSSAVAAAATTATASSYDTTILSDNPVAYWTMGNASSGSEADQTGHGHNGSYVAGPGTTTLPDGETASVFNGTSQYFEVPDADDLSVTQTGVLTIEAWVRPDVTTFPHEEGTGYVHWMGKGASGNQEYVSRMYGLDNTEGRANRISGYCFNGTGGLGAGSYFQDTVTPGQWIYYVLVINKNGVSGSYPNGYTKIYKNGVLRAQTDLSINGTIIVPSNGTAPFRVGTRDFASYFQGAVGKVAIFGAELSATTILAHYNAM